jgi:hypothetical protein
MRESKQKCGNFTVIAGNLEGLELQNEKNEHYFLTQITAD